MEIVDSYCHIGLPRFSSAEDVIATFDLFGIDRGVVVLGPQVPDYTSLSEALERFPSRVRAIGIPFGKTEEQVRQGVGLQIQAGISGLRVEPGELEHNPWLLEVLGQNELWLYAINWIDHPDLFVPLLRWLDQYPGARLAAPHFLQPRPFPSHPAARQILAHPHFYAIFSRHGGMGARQPYPHPDLRPWVEEVAGLAGWEHILWGSEYPVFYWRGETLPACRGWLASLLPELSKEVQAAYLGKTAGALFFNSPPPPREVVQFPAWVQEQFNLDRSVSLFQNTSLHLPMSRYAGLHRRFIAAQKDNPVLTLDEFVTTLLSELC
jgi:hypothetical protein